MILAELLRDTNVLQFDGPPALNIDSLAYDSRRVRKGCLFFAIQGNAVDGHNFLEQALRSGAIGVASERAKPADFPVAWVRVPNIRRALAAAARAFYGYPDRRLRIAGITGTNGKTTTAYLLHSIFESAGIKSGLLGTIEYRTTLRSDTAHHTTLESLELAAYFDELAREGGQAAVMEVSSHALAQERVWGVRFEAAIFTNLTVDHLDFHKDLESYFAAKRRLFEGLGTPPPELGVINLDDPWGEQLLKLPQPRQLTYGISSNAQVKVRHFGQDAKGIHATLSMPEGKLEVESPLLGRANLANILAAAAAASGMNIANEQIRQGIRRQHSVPGRFEQIDEKQPYLVLVDYAHTHDALKQALQTARGLTLNRLIVVFGCGGDRDRSKRPLMGEVAGKLSDAVVLTSDNPRSEDPFLIMNDAMVGLQRSGASYVAEVDRERAIRLALEQAREGDVVLIAGKGHETCQVFKDRTIVFDDREVSRRILRDLGFRGPDRP